MTLSELTGGGGPALTVIVALPEEVPPVQFASDRAVTVRERDTGEQARVPIAKLAEHLRPRFAL